MLKSLAGGGGGGGGGGSTITALQVNETAGSDYSSYLPTGYTADVTDIFVNPSGGNLFLSGLAFDKTKATRLWNSGSTNTSIIYLLPIGSGGDAGDEIRLTHNNDTSQQIGAGGGVLVVYDAAYNSGVGAWFVMLPQLLVPTP